MVIWGTSSIGPSRSHLLDLVFILQQPTGNQPPSHKPGNTGPIRRVYIENVRCMPPEEIGTKVVTELLWLAASLGY